MAVPRVLVGALTLTLLGAALAGCTGTEPDPTPSTSPSPTASSPTASSPVAEGPLTVAVYGDKRKVRAYEQIVEAYRAENPEVEVELRSFRDADTVVEPLLTGETAANAPDVFLADVGHLAELVTSSALVPVDTVLDEAGLQFGDDYQRAALNAFSANDRLQCMPAEMSPLVVYYNEQLAAEVDTEEPVELPTEEKAGWQWEEFVTAATAVAELDGPGGVKGAWFPADVETLTAFVRSAGGEVVDDPVEPTSLNLTSDEALTAVRNLATFARDPSLFPTKAELQARSALSRFRAGDLGFYIGTRADLPRLRAGKALPFDVLPLPSMGRFQSVSSMDGWCVSGSSEQVAAATDFIAFAVGERGFEIAAESGVLVPAGLDVIHDESFTQPARRPENAHVYSTSVRRSEPMPYSTAWDEVAGSVEELLQRLYTLSDINLEEALEQRMERLNEQSVELFTPPEPQTQRPETQRPETQEPDAGETAGTGQ